MNIGTIKFEDLTNVKEFGIIVTGAGGNIQEWIDGIDGLLKENDIVDKNVPTFSSCSVISENNRGEDGRTDILLMFNIDCKVNVGKLAIWRISFGSVCWIEDFIVNYKKDYTVCTEYSEDNTDYNCKCGC